MPGVRVLVTIAELESRGDLLDGIRRVSPEVDLKYRPCQSPDEVLEALDPEVNVLYTQHVPLDLRSASGLRWVQIHHTGVEDVVASSLRDSGILVTNDHTHAILMSEYVLGSLVLLSRGFSQLVLDKEGRVWERSHSPHSELRGKTVGVVGYGAVGRAVASLCHAVGMRVIASKRTPNERGAARYEVAGVGDPEGAIPERIFPPSGTREMMAESDYVVICLPSTPETRGAIGREELSAMKRSAYLVNVSRGEVVDEPSLLEALREKRIAGAALDVFTKEPLPKESPFWDLGESVFISPHISGGRQMSRYNDVSNAAFVENLRRFISGRDLLNVVDKGMEY